MGKPTYACFGSSHFVAIAAGMCWGGGGKDRRHLNEEGGGGEKILNFVSK